MNRVFSMLRVAVRFTGWVAVPVLLLVALSLLSGVVRTTALGAFCVVVALKAAMTVLDLVGEYAPNPVTASDWR
ncbi:hypothetical protein ACFQ0O_36220 [Saccharopolyspora spinosporotrichia]